MALTKKVIEDFKKQFREEEGRDITDSEFEQVNNELDALVEILFQHWVEKHKIKKVQDKYDT